MDIDKNTIITPFSMLTPTSPRHLQLRHIRHTLTHTSSYFVFLWYQCLRIWDRNSSVPLIQKSLLCKNELLLRLHLRMLDSHSVPLTFPFKTSCYMNACGYDTLHLITMTSWKTGNPVSFSFNHVEKNRSCPSLKSFTATVSQKGTLGSFPSSAPKEDMPGQ